MKKRPLSSISVVKVIGLELFLLAMCSSVATVRGSAQSARKDASAIQATSETKSQSEIVGLWQGSLVTPQRTLRIVIKFSISPQGNVVGSLDSPDQGLQGLPLETITVQGGALIFDFRPGQAHYEGHLTRSPDKIEGTWSQAGHEAPLNFERIQTAPPMVDRPQTPHPPYPYKSEQVSYSNDSANIKLAGTLTMPAGPGPFPAAILLTIAGPEDRDQTNGTHKHFLVLADYLNRHGIAVLRSDNRGVGESTGKYYKATIHDRAGDTLAALRPGPDAPRGILGIPLFANLLLTLDYPEIVLSQGGLPPANGADILTLGNTESGLFSVPVSVAGVSLQATLDTGAGGGGFGFPAEYMEKLPLVSKPTEVGLGRMAGGEVVIFGAKLNGTLKVGPHTFDSPTVNFNGRLKHINLNSGILANFSVTIDERRIVVEEKQIYLQRISADRGEEPKIKLNAISHDEFSLEGIPSARVKFERDDHSAVTKLHVLNASGRWEGSKKNKP